MSANKILIYGYGNPGRQDDGLGNAFVEEMEKWIKKEKLTGFSFDSNYQLNIEDADAISTKDLVVFVDASTEEIENFILTPVNATTDVAFTSHAASPGYIVSLCRDIYDKIPPTYLLHIKGYKWGFKEGLTAKAKDNLAMALEHMKGICINPKILIDQFKDF